jgi:hypothetical protein
MACAPCQKAKAAAAKAAAERRVADAAKIVVTGAAAMVGLVSKEKLVSTVEQIEQAAEAKNVKRYGAP